MSKRSEVSASDQSLLVNMLVQNLEMKNSPNHQETFNGSSHSSRNSFQKTVKTNPEQDWEEYVKKTNLILPDSSQIHPIQYQTVTSVDEANFVQDFLQLDINSPYYPQLQYEIDPSRNGTYDTDSTYQQFKNYNNHSGFSFMESSPHFDFTSDQLSTHYMRSSSKETLENNDPPFSSVLGSIETMSIEETISKEKPPSPPQSKNPLTRSWADVANSPIQPRSVTSAPKAPAPVESKRKEKTEHTQKQQQFFKEKSHSSSNINKSDQSGTNVGSPMTVRHSPGLNGENFDINPTFARFFVIKSYSEDDVHKAIKYNIWASTDTGNKRLDTAFRESASKGPIYLFFSVNASGQFCGMAQMTSAVDYEKKCDLWTQDKWKGQFQLKWIFIKDIPNNYLRHIRLENNENKPVTNSRDTQEIFLEQGKEMLKIFQSFKSKTSIIDDFTYYDQRQEQMKQKKLGESGSSEENLEISTGGTRLTRNRNTRPNNNKKID